MNALYLSRSTVCSARSELVPFCISGRSCNKPFCICDLLQINMQTINPERIFTTLLICDECYHQLYDDYKIFESKVKALRSNFFESYVAVKTSAMQNKIKNNNNIDGYACGRTDCNYHEFTLEQRDQIYQKFKTMYEAFACINLRM